MPNQYNQSIRGAKETSPNALAAYRSIEAALTTDITYDAITEFGDARFATLGSIINTDGANAFTIAFSEDGTTFGDEIPVDANQVFDFSRFIAWRSLRISHTANSSYRLIFA